MEDIDHSDSAWNIGAIFDSTLEMKQQVGQICKTAWDHIRNTGKIRPSLNTPTAEKLMHYFVSTELEQLNNLLFGLPKWHLKKLQRVQNAAATLVTGTRKYDHIKQVLYDLP